LGLRDDGGNNVNLDQALFDTTDPDILRCVIDYVAVGETTTACLAAV
jgi:hypothetical protein